MEEWEGDDWRDLIITVASCPFGRIVNTVHKLIPMRCGRGSVPVRIVGVQDAEAAWEAVKRSESQMAAARIKGLAVRVGRSGQVL